ncbi:MAG: hypothetical protein NVS3B20_14990 [Polyangiales bacterium]
MVEDDPDISQSLCAILLHEGYDILAVATLDDARAALDAKPVALMLLDLMLSAERGQVLLEELADRATSPPVVLLSGSLDAIGLAGRFGIRSVGKPFDVDSLVTVISMARYEQSRPIRPAASP